MSFELTHEESMELCSFDGFRLAAALRRCMAEVERLQGVVVVTLIEQEQGLQMLEAVQRGNAELMAEVERITALHAEAGRLVFQARWESERLQGELTAAVELCQTYMAERGEARAAQIVAEQAMATLAAVESAPAPGVEALAFSLEKALRCLLEEYDDRAAQFGGDYLWTKREDVCAIENARAVLSALQPAQAGVKKCKRCDGVGMEELWLGEFMPCRDCNTETHSAPQKPAQAEPEEQKCCQYCAHFEGDGCPVKDASPWSRWGNWCNVFAPRRSVGRPIRLAPAEQALEERRVGERRVVRPLTRITGGRVIYSENESWWECRLPGSDRRKEAR